MRRIVHTRGSTCSQVIPALDATAIFTATLVLTDGDATTPRPLLVTPPDASGRRTLTLNETVAGDYSLAVMLGSTPLAGSPYAVTVIARAPVGAITVALGRDIADGHDLVAGGVAVVMIDAWDAFGNAAYVDVESDVSVAFSLQPGGRQVVRGVVQFEAALESEGDEARGAWRASANLTAAGTYSVSVLVLGQRRCVDEADEGAEAATCVPDVEVVPGRSVASASLMTGAGVNDMTAGAAALLRVVPLDRWGNHADWVHSSIDLRYQLTATRVVNSSDPSQVCKICRARSNEPPFAWVITCPPHDVETRTLRLASCMYGVCAQGHEAVVVGPTALQYSTWDDAHELAYTLTRAGVYDVAVEMLEPRWYQETSYLVTRRPVRCASPLVPRPPHLARRLPFDFRPSRPHHRQRRYHA